MTEISRVNIQQQIKAFEPKSVKVDAKKKESAPPSTSDQVTLGQDNKSEGIFKATFHSQGTSRIQAGYDQNFLGSDVNLPLPQVTGPAAENVLDLNGKGDTVREYTHFSIVMNKDRKLAFFTAHNIDGTSLRHDIRRTKWDVDREVGNDNQLDNRIYKNNPLDRGHMVRRMAVVWGDKSEAKAANDDTFYYTNATPQHGNLNQKKWLDLENWLLDNAADSNKKVSVFTGPVFREDDVKYRGEKIPADFWKVIVVKKENGDVAAAGFTMSQKKWIQNMKSHEKIHRDYPGDQKVQTEDVVPYQVSIESIEKMTNLDFGNVKDIDAYSLYKAKQQQPYTMTQGGQLLAVDTPKPDMPHRINSMEDIII